MPNPISDDATLVPTLHNIALSRLAGSNSCFLLLMGQICSLLLTRIRTFSPGLENNNTLKCWSGIFPWTLIYIIMLKNCQNNISMYGCSPIQGKRFLFLLKFYEARISEWNILVWTKLLCHCTGWNGIIIHNSLVPHPGTSHSLHLRILENKKKTFCSVQKLRNSHTR